MKISFKSKILNALILAGLVVGCGWLFQSPQQNAPFAAEKNGKVWTELDSKEKSSSQNAPIESLNKIFIDLNKRLSGAVVNIYTKTRIAPRFEGGRSRRGGGPMNPDDLFQYFFGNPFGGGGDLFGQAPREAQSLGSGFVISSDGMIITNSHVVRSSGKTADSIMVKFLEDPETSKGHEATLLGVDETSDVALLKIKKPRKMNSIAPLGNSDSVQVGEWVVAIGNPYGHQNSFTKGVVSALGRDLEQSRADFIQTDASINPGNSGGPLINLYGEVVGINTAIDARAQGIGFAIPINIAKNVVKQLVEKGEVTLGWIGVGMSELSPEVSKSLGMKEEATGVLVQEVFPGEPADKAGLKSYDVIVEVNGKKITKARDLMVAISGLSVGTQVPVKVFREGTEKTLTVTIAKRKSAQQLARNNKGRGGEPDGGAEDSDPQGSRLKGPGVVLLDLTPELRRRLDLDSDVNGVVISEVYPESPAARAGLNPGDVIVEIDRKPVFKVSVASGLLKKNKSNFLLKVQRGTASVIVVLDMKENGE